MAVGLPDEGILEFTLQGSSPLLMHNERMANPMDHFSRKLKSRTGKRKKTDEDYELIAQAEFAGGLYFDEVDRPKDPEEAKEPESGHGYVIIPSHCIYAMVRETAKLFRLGTTVKQGVRVDSSFGFPLVFPWKNVKKGEAPKVRITELWKAGGFIDQRMVGNQKARVLRTRPRFDVWSLRANLTFDLSVFDGTQLQQIIDVAGRKIGLGDYRPRFGRFDVVDIKLGRANGVEKAAPTSTEEIAA